MSLRRKYRFFKVVSLALVFNLFFQLLFPTISMALTSGPSQPEVQSFSPIETTEMVDVFSGDFTYNIPLFEVPGPNGGYPFNLVYNSGVTMDQESSWTGLGWNLSPGAITRQMRGFPDEYNNAKIKKQQDLRTNITFGGGMAVDLEVFGASFKEIANLSMGIGVYYNNYKGVGYKIEPTLGFHNSFKNGMTAGVGFDLKLDSQEGVGADASLALSDIGENSAKGINLGIGYNSRVGLTNFSMGPSYQGKSKASKALAGLGSFVGANLFMAGNPYTPSIGMEMSGTTVSLSVKGGFAAFGTFINGSVNGFCTSQWVKERNMSIPAYGYMNLQNATDRSLMDFNREKDGMIRKTSPNLAIPNMTYDIYSISGQGVGGMFRPYRNDVGVLHDASMSSKTVGGSAGVDIGPGLSPHVGANVTVNYSESSSGKWSDDNFVKDSYSFTGVKDDGSLTEPYFFKMAGEHTSESISQLSYIGDSDPVSPVLDFFGSGVDLNYQASAKFNEKSISLQNSNPNIDGTTKRRPRNTVVAPVNNDRSLNQGFYVLKEDGSRYVYSEPVKNLKNIECQFSLPANTDKCSTTVNIPKSGENLDHKKYKESDQYLNKTTMETPYAHSYLLKEVLGSDYIDADGNGEASEGDFGYWVKFTYKQTNSNYKWRVPFNGANYVRGLNTTDKDDKGSYMYGEKEVKHLEKVETKSHVAFFSTSARKDARGAGKEYQNEGDALGESSYKLDQIHLYTKAEYNKGTNRKPIKTVNFEYSYDLCQGLPNNDGADDKEGILSSKNPKDGSIKDVIKNSKGKLTLKKVWFTFENNYRGRLSPYEFDYKESITAQNPSYHTHKYNRWGNYKELSTQEDICRNVDFPYDEQFSSTNTTKKAELDRGVSVWNLKEIKLPSGGKIKIDYESDDYAYVQNKVAMQMVNIASLAPYSTTKPVESTISHPRFSGGRNRRIYFELEKPIKNDANKDIEIAKYFDNTGKLYFKIWMKIRKVSDALEDVVSGYADISKYGVDEGAKNPNGEFTRGWVELGDVNGFHPISAAAWQHIRTNAPDLSGLGPFDEPSNSTQDKVNKIKSLVSIIPTVAQTFVGFRTYANSNGWGFNLPDLKKAYIRLNTPDKIKFGGGVRVKRITLSDEWESSSAEKSSVYGQVYDYTTEENGEVISSGVATYEPMVGADENALRNVKEYPDKIPLKTNNNLYFELPVNENYYPAPSVGYRKVTVKSLATAYSKIANNELNIPSGIMTTGATVHEFYTAKEFPVIPKETTIDKKPFDLFIPLPFLGQITINNLTASQGYSIELNDMHGKPKRVTNLREVKDKDGNITYEKVSWVQYNYKVNAPHKVDGNPANDYFSLNNVVPVLVRDISDNNVKVEDRIVGQDYEFFTDMRQSKTYSCSGGAKINTDVIILPFFVLPAFVPWPSVGSSTNMVRTAVTNKIIHKAGILESIEAYDEGSRVKTENKYFDHQTGKPIFTIVNNNYEDPIYDYSVPAHFAYEGMGAAYKNVGLMFKAKFTDEGKGISSIATSTDLESVLVPGDEFLAGNVKVVYRNKANSKLYFTVPKTMSGDYTFSLVRSGRRNILSANAGNIKTLGDKNNANTGNPLVNANRKQ